MITLRNTKTNALMKIEEAKNWHNIKDVGYTCFDEDLFIDAKKAGMKIYVCSVNGVADKRKFFMSPKAEKPVDLVGQMLDTDIEDWIVVDHNIDDEPHSDNVIQFPS